MEYSVQSIISEVRKALDENSTSALLIDDNETLTLDAIITQKIPDAVRSVTKAAPSRLLDGGISFASTLIWSSGTTGIGMASTVLPDDFMRLIIFQMSDWKRPVLEPIEDTDPTYFLQKSKFSGIRGNVDKPVCAITTYSIGKVMEMYSSVEGDSVNVKMAKYLAYPEIVDGNISICKKLYTPVIYYIAGLVCATFKDKTQSDILMSISKDYING